MADSKRKDRIRKLLVEADELFRRALAEGVNDFDLVGHFENHLEDQSRALREWRETNRENQSRG